MRAFSQLLDGLVYTRSRNGKLDLIASYMTTAPDPDRGWALAALTGNLDIKAVKASTIAEMARSRTDPVLFEMSRDYVGDLAETVSLLWPMPDGAAEELDDGSLTLSAIVERLHGVSRAAAPATLAQMMDHLDASGRFALLKLATGGLRVGISARLAKTGFAQAFGLDVDDVEECWHALAPPYAAEWKWDGIRIQIVGTGAEHGNQTRLYSRAGDDITATFPDIAQAFAAHAVLDGELLVKGEFQGGEAASFNALQQRLGRKAVTARMMEDYPAFVRLYDILLDGDEDLRALPWEQRRARLEATVPTLDPHRFDISALIEAPDFEGLADLRAGARDAAIEGVMLKRRDSPYVAGRKAALWYKWKRDPLTADCVMMYAQRGHGKRSSFYSDYTFGC